MVRKIPHPIILEYSETNIGKYRSVRHYQSTNKELELLSPLLNISKDRKCAKSSPIYWLQTHNGKNWVKPRLTGLFKTKVPNTYYGDININRVKTHLLLFEFSEDMPSLKVFYFKDYHSKDVSHAIKFLTA